MTKTKSTKRALLLSALSLLMCVSMLIGSTFAWFTDSVTSSGNKIVAGNLDVQLLMDADVDGTYDDISDSTSPIFGKGSIAQNNNAATLWEPGKTQVAYLAIKNNGNLDLKYTVGLNVQNVSKDLYEVMEYAIVPDADANNKVTAWNGGNSVVLGTQSVSGNVELKVGETHYFALAIHMDELAGNEYQNGEVNFDLTVLATQLASESDSFGNQYDINANVYNVTTTEEAQAALDNVKKGDVIVLAPANYGTLYLRPTTNTNVTKEIDWQGNNYVWETYSLFEDITILGTTGAVVDAIEIEGGTYYNTEHSQAATYPVMLSLVELKNVVIDGVTFTGNGGQYGDDHGNAICLAGNNIKVDGLTLKNCVLKDSTNKNRLLYKSESTTKVHTYTYGSETFTFSPSLKNITVTGCTFNGGYMGLELRETENVTITNNVFNVADRNILLPVNPGCTYSGNITITGNVSNNAKERFVRADGTGDAVVVIKNNTLNAYMGADADYIKVTNGNNVTIENNTKN